MNGITSTEDLEGLKGQIQTLKNTHYFFVRITDDIEIDMKNNASFHNVTYRSADDKYEYYQNLLQECYDAGVYVEVDEDGDFCESDDYIWDMIRPYKNGFALFAHDGLAVTSIEDESELLNSITNNTFVEFLEKNSWEGNGQTNYYSVDSNEVIVLGNFDTNYGNICLLACREAKEERALSANLIRIFEQNSYESNLI